MILPVSNIHVESLWLKESKVYFAWVAPSRPHHFKVIFGTYRIPWDCHILFCISYTYDWLN